MKDPLTEQIIAAAIEVHRHMGTGLLESIYEEALGSPRLVDGIQRVSLCPLWLKTSSRARPPNKPMQRTGSAVSQPEVTPCRRPMSGVGSGLMVELMAHGGRKAAQPPTPARFSENPLLRIFAGEFWPPEYVNRGVTHGGHDPVTLFPMKRVTCLLALAVIVVSPARGQDAALDTLPPGVTKATRRAIQKGLKFLAREQNADGSWRTGGGWGTYPVAMSSLAGLALLGSGSTPVRGKYAKNVRRVTNFVLSQQQPNGLLAAPSEEGRSMYGHGFGTLFLSQVYGMEEDKTRQRRIKSALKRAIQLIARSQSRDGGWLYTPDSRGDEGSVTVTQIQALRGCRNAGIHVPVKVIKLAIKYIERSQNPDGGISYSVRSRGSRPAISAAACAVLYNAGKYDSQMATKCFKYAWRYCQPTTSSGGHYYYTQLYMSQASWQKGEKYWKKYYRDIQSRLLRLQQGNGSWSGDHVGLVYGTSIALLIFQIPYNNLPILSR